MIRLPGLALLCCLLPLTAVQAEQVCASLSDSQKVWVTGHRSSDASLHELQKRMDDFIALAQQSSSKGFKMKTLITQYSRFDASQEHVAKELKTMPDKYSLYGGIDRASVVMSVDWGQYKVAVVQYSYQGQVAEEAQAFFCARGGCRISNILERGKLPEDIALRFIHRLKRTNWQGSDCPSKPASYALAPSVGPTGAGSSLTVHLNYSIKFPPLNPEEAALPDALLRASMGDFYRCVKQARQHETDDLYSDTSYSAVKSFLSDCTLNMDLGSMVPVLRGSKLSYLPPISLMNLLRDSQLQPLAWVTDNGVNYRVYEVKAENQSVTTLMMLPLVGNNKVKMDWNYFGHDFSYLYLTPGFKRLVSVSS